MEKPTSIINVQNINVSIDKSPSKKHVCEEDVLREKHEMYKVDYIYMIYYTYTIHMYRHKIPILLLLLLFYTEFTCHPATCLFTV